MSQLPKQIIDLLKRCFSFAISVERECDVDIPDKRELDKLAETAGQLRMDIDDILEPPDQN